MALYRCAGGTYRRYDKKFDWFGWWYRLGRVVQLLVVLKRLGWVGLRDHKSQVICGYALRFVRLALGGMKEYYGHDSIRGLASQLADMDGPETERSTAYELATDVLKLKNKELKNARTLVDYMREYESFFLRFTLILHRLEKPGKLSKDEVAEAELLLNFFSELYFMCAVEAGTASKLGVSQEENQPDAA